MSLIIRPLCYSVLIWQILAANAQHKSHLYCYYMKDCQQNTPRDGISKLKSRFLEAAAEVRGGSVDTMTSNSGVNGFYRPRSALARAMYEKQHNDRYLQELDQNEWYRVNKERLCPDLIKKFVQLYPDEETKEFLSASIDKSSWVWTQIWYLLAKAVLRHFWSVTDINGWLGRGSMFVLSEAQARALLRVTGHGIGAGALVDVGAGDGEVSRRFAHIYPHNYATEISASMRKTLAEKGYKLLDTEKWHHYRQFDCICMLNLLDRCSKPKTMLKQARDALAPGGVLMLALVLPYKPYVEVTSDHKPEERLPIEGLYFEDQLTAFVKFMREEAGFELVSWSRAPYLCEGDFAQAYYWLDDSVYVFKPTAVDPAS
ncbi:protein-L-histidine N-pros-methyltransferase [Helicoverpa zea]|uniref:protein-L-histidine N-pros-methyltransferase n=1 Tax=Helicoverpa zea TaxID=7113 RepID=UPI001F55C3F5|nr:protein-L-histidine N-pros-methyltransferase [Helicoverpa armigera]XP_047026930.1 protein-L-histidine N-pros-methyltransferase [Helicoverpa zea]